MLAYNTHEREIDDIIKIINTGRFYSITFIKRNTDAEIRYLNGHKAIYKKPDGSEEEVPVVRKPSYDRVAKNLLLVWDRNAVDPKTGVKGAYRSAGLENILYVKSGSQILDFTKENQILERFKNIDENKLAEIRRNMKMDSVVQEEIENLLNINI